MSVNASTTVSIVPALTAPRSWSSVSMPGRPAALPDSDTSKDPFAWQFLARLACKFLLDGGKLLRRALDPRPLEPLPGRSQVPAARPEQHDRRRHGGVV